MNPPPLSPSHSPAPPPLLREKTWWGRNWKWMVPLLAFAGLALFIGCILAFVFGISGVMKNSDPYQHTVALAKNTPAVIDALGTPITEGFMPVGKINVSSVNGRGSGTAKLLITLKGPESDATITVDAEKTEDVWHYKLVLVRFPATGKLLNLTQQANAQKSIEAP